MRRLAFAASAEHGALVDDDLLAAEPLRELGYAVEPWIWDGARPATAGLEGVVIRSCWDYHQKPQAFRAWLESLAASGARVLNPARTALWNLDKSYLWEVASWGFPVPDTVWLEAGVPAELERVMTERDFRDAVIKPSISLGGFDTWRVSDLGLPRSQAKLDDLLRSRKMMLQVFVPEIASEGEVSVIFFGGKFSHAVLKHPGDGDFRGPTRARRPP